MYLFIDGTHLLVVLDITPAPNNLGFHSNSTLILAQSWISFQSFVI